MAVTRYLADKSVWARMRQRKVLTEVQPLLERGLLDTCGMVDLEVLYSARNGDEHDHMEAERRSLNWLPMNDEIWIRAREVQRIQAQRGKHRSVALPDLLIAATAERHRVTVLHYDSDFDLIAEVTEQPTKWVLPPGEAD